MRLRACVNIVALIGLGVAILGGPPSYAASAPAAKSTAAAAATNPPPPTAISKALPPPPEIPASQFVIPVNPKNGRNPFFPQSTARQEKPQAAPVKENRVDSSAFVLNGLTSPPRQSAMINGRTFVAGEQGEVRLPSGQKAVVKCTEIGKNSVTIVVEGQPIQLRLRSSLQ